MSAHLFPRNCIVPPYMLKEIIERGTPAQRELAVKTLRVTTQMTEQRKEVSETGQPLLPTAAPGAAVAVKNRVVYTANQTGNLPGQAVRREGDPAASDVAVNEAYDGAGLTYDLYYQVYNHNSIDNQGLRIDSTVHYMKSYDNAFWNGSQMVYGDGDEDLPEDQRLFNRFTISVDVIGHELTHGVMQYGSNLIYAGQSGALNESFSDVFGIMVKQRRNNETASQSDWIIGQGLFTTNVNAIGIRSMSAPGTAYDDPLLGKDPQPAHMRDYVTTIEDNGGVHINSGIPNRAFYVTAVEIGGYSWEKAGQIWYAALTGRLPSSANFQLAADTIYTIAGELYGANSLEQQAVSKGWAEVGVTVGSTTPIPTPNPNPGCLSSLLGIFRPRS